MKTRLRQTIRKSGRSTFHPQFLAFGFVWCNFWPEREFNTLEDGKNWIKKNTIDKEIFHEVD